MGYELDVINFCKSNNPFISHNSDRTHQTEVIVSDYTPATKISNATNPTICATKISSSVKDQDSPKIRSFSYTNHISLTEKHAETYKTDMGRVGFEPTTPAMSRLRIW